MKHKLLIATTLILGAMGAQSAMAQSSSGSNMNTSSAQTPATRSEVHNDAVRANNTPMNRKIQPEVEANPDNARLKPMASGTSQPKTRQDVRAEAIRARDAGEIPRGDAVTTRALEKKKAEGQTPKTREEVSSEVPGARVRGEIKDQKDPKSSANTNYR